MSNSILNIYSVKIDTSQIMNLKMILQVEELNLPEDKCNEDRNYDFNDCVRKNISQQVG